MHTVESTAGEQNATAAPLTGVRVLDFTHIVAGPFCTRILADLGAEVLHVETQTRTEGLGIHPDRRDVRVDRNKKSITLNLKHDAGRATAIRLASVAAVIVENFSTGVMARLGLGYAVLQPANPGLIYVSMSGFGHTGPRRDWTSMNMNLQGYSGLMLATGAEGDPPTPVSNSWNDFVASLHATFGILQALMERRRTGQGRFLDLAQAECSIATLGGLVLAAGVSRQDPPRLGNRSTAVAPQGVYACAGTDQWCAISVQTDQQWRALCEVMGKQSLAEDERFASVVGRFRHHDEIDEQIRAWTSELSKEAVQAQLAAAGVPAERVRHADAVVNSEDSGQVFKWVDVPGLGKPDLAAGLPFAFSRSQTFEPEAPPLIGAHTRPALREWIGLSDAEIDQLDAAGALV